MTNYPVGLHYTVDVPNAARRALKRPAQTGQSLLKQAETKQTSRFSTGFHLFSLAALAPGGLHGVMWRYQLSNDQKHCRVWSLIRLNSKGIECS